MMLYIYYPFFSVETFLTVIVNNDFEIYWQASKIFKVLNRKTKSIGKTLEKIFKYEHLVKFQEIQTAKKYNSYFLTTDQVRRLLTDQDEEFGRFMENLLIGQDVLLHPKAARDFQKMDYIIRDAPFQPIGISVLCLDRSLVSPATVHSASTNTVLPGFVFNRKYLFSFPEIVQKLKNALNYSSTTSTSNATDDPFKMEIDESKSFEMTDFQFQNKYMFHAVRATWLPGPACVTINPFITSYNNEDFYLYVPVKKSQ